MKRIVIATMALLVSSAQLVIAQSKSISEQLSLLPPSATGTLVVANISGDVSVESYDGSNIEITYTKTVDGNSNAIVTRGLEEIEVKHETYSDTIVVFIDHPCAGKKQRQSSGQIWKYYWGDCEWNPEYSHDIDFKVKVPRNLGVRISTINNGDVTVSGIRGDVDAENINGHVTLNDVGGGKLRASTINGNVDIKCPDMPTTDSRIYTLNGDINAWFPESLSADMTFETFNGDFFTDFDPELISITAKEAVHNKKGISYKIGGYPKMRLGNGAIHLDIETFNGDAYIKKITTQ